MFRRNTKNTRVIISYMSENYAAVRKLYDNLVGNGLDVFMDKPSLEPGEAWSGKFERVAQKSGSILIVFSDAYDPTAKRTFNREVEFLSDLKKKHASKTLIPIRLSECQIPDTEIGGGQALSDLHYMDLFGLPAQDNLLKILSTLGVKNPSVTVAPKSTVRVVRRDEDGIPIQFRVNDEKIKETKKQSFSFDVEPGEHSFVCSLYKTTRVLSGRGFYAWLARAHEIVLTIEPFSDYVWEVDGSNYRRLTVNPGMVLIRAPLRLVGQERVRIDDYKTWPQSIKSQITRLANTDSFDAS
ncbi:MAG: toll/interleukin-1 receptor domain-containing protein [Pseudomonadota bacterium]